MFSGKPEAQARVRSLHNGLAVAKLLSSKYAVRLMFQDGGSRVAANALSNPDLMEEQE